MKCPVCNKHFSEEESRYLPFCSPRCKMIDAKRWLNEEYFISRVNEDELEKEIAQWEKMSVPNSDKN